MKNLIYVIEDEYCGITLFVEGEIVDFNDGEPPEVIINEISYGEKPLELWCFSDRYMMHLKDRIFQQWVSED